MLINIALLSETSLISDADVMKVSAALQQQVLRDFDPVWKTRASVDPFLRLEDVPVGYWPVIVRDDIGFPGAAGIHLDDEGNPFGLVQASADWTLTSSHEVLEILGDPWGNRLTLAPSMSDSNSTVEYLVEVCDPCEAIELGYKINGVVVSDFYTPSYFDSIVGTGVRYSYTGALAKPLEVLRGGYISWRDPDTTEWWQRRWFSGSEPVDQCLGRLETANENFRAELDRRAIAAEQSARESTRNAPPLPLQAATLTAAVPTPRQSNAHKAAALHSQIDRLKQTHSHP